MLPCLFQQPPWTKSARWLDLLYVKNVESPSLPWFLVTIRVPLGGRLQAPEASTLSQQQQLSVTGLMFVSWVAAHWAVAISPITLMVAIQLGREGV